MSKNKTVLGRGLGALLSGVGEPDMIDERDLPTDDGKSVGTICAIDIARVRPNPFQPRVDFSPQALDELKQSILENGVIQPITVRKAGFNTYQLISGERRLRASKLAGLKTIPSYIRIANDQDSLTMALVENIQRHDLDPIEIALSYQRLIDEIQLTQEQMSDRVGKKRSTIANYLRLLKLDPVIQTGIRDGFISMGHGRAIINIEDHDAQADIYQKIVSKNLSVRETEALVKQYQEGAKPKTAAKTKSGSFDVNKEQSALADYLGAKADVKVAANGKGKITIPFKSEADFNRIINLIKGA